MSLKRNNPILMSAMVSMLESEGIPITYAGETKRPPLPMQQQFEPEPIVIEMPRGIEFRRGEKPLAQADKTENIPKLTKPNSYYKDTNQYKKVKRWITIQ